MQISVEWDGRAIRQAFGACNIVADGVATLADGRRFRINASASRAGRKPAVTLRYMTAAKRGAEVREGALPEVRAAALASFAELIAPLRAEFIAKAQAADAAYMAERRGEVASEPEAAPDAESALETLADRAEAPAPRFAYVVAVAGSRAFLCEGGVYSDRPQGEYSDNTLERAHRDAGEYNARYDSRYEVRASLAGVAVESEVRASLEAWQLAAIDAPASEPEAPGATLVANTTRACYWRTVSGHYVATRADDPRPAGDAPGYRSLESIMRLKGESSATIAKLAPPAMLEACSPYARQVATLPPYRIAAELDRLQRLIASLRAGKES